jgi:AcrR family transcriptional regulator
MASDPFPTRAAPKGEVTRQRIIDRALALAGTLGLEGLTIGELASDLGLSKSGLFAHFKSKERLQLDVLDAAAAHFSEQVFARAIKAPRGEPRLVAIFENWLAWIGDADIPGGCVFLASAMEWDDRDGPVRSALVDWFEQLCAGLVKAARIAVDEGHFRSDLDLSQFAGELHAIVLKYHLDRRLLRSERSLRQAQTSLERLLAFARVERA